MPRADGTTCLSNIPGIDLDKPVPCQEFRGCDREGTWTCTCPCCGNRSTLCMEHKRLQVLTYEDMLMLGDVECGHCNADPMPTPVWREL